MGNSTDLGARLRVIRKEMGMSQEELARRMGMSYMTIRRWETGQRSPRAEEIKRLAAILGVGEEALWGEAPARGKVRITLTWDREEVEGEIDMSGNGFSLFLGADGTVGIKGAAKFTRRADLKEAVEAILKELEFGYDAQVLRGKLKPEE